MTTKTGAAPVPDERTVVITRIFDAPRALVFAAWTDPKHMGRWWGPTDFTNPVCEMDVRPGGAFRIVMRAPDGTDYPLKGFYREVARPERLVMTMDLSEHPAAWHDLVDPKRDKRKAPVLDALLTVTFAERDGKTIVTIGSRFETAAIRDAMMRMGMEGGWNLSLDRLAAELARMAKG